MLLVTDLHLTDRERDEYRWKIFDTIAETAEVGESVLILGDLTDAKDGHSAKLVNRIVDALVEIHGRVYVLKGNHDYRDADWPFFRFLGHDRFRKFKLPTFVTKIEVVTIDDMRVLMLPHTATPVEDWDKLDIEDLSVDMIVMHQTVHGANAGTHELSSPLPSRYWTKRWFKGLVVSGDIHVPQVCGEVLYVGCPYPVAFGDSFKPRMIRVVKGAAPESIPVSSIKRVRLDLFEMSDLEEAELRRGDQAKIVVHLPRARFVEWDEYQKSVQERAQEMGVTVFSIELKERKDRGRIASEEAREAAKKVRRATPREQFESFCQVRDVDDVVASMGQSFISKT